jgi:hypothetical protein
MRGDQLALSGASQLLDGALRDRLPAEVRAAWAPALTEAALAQHPGAPACHLMSNLARRSKKAAVPLLLGALRGQIAIAAKASAVGLDELSPAACAIAALTAADPAVARTELARWQPTAPADRLVAGTARTRLGDAGALDATLFDSHSVTVQLLALDAIEAAPTRSAMDLLVERAVGHRYVAVADRAQAIFAEMTGAPTTELGGLDQDQRGEWMKRWWSQHRDEWRPPHPR